MGAADFGGMMDDPLMSELLVAIAISAMAHNDTEHFNHIWGHGDLD